MPPLSLTRPRRQSAADTAAAIQASLHEEAKAKGTRDEGEHEGEPAAASSAARKRKTETASGSSKAPKTESYAVLKSGLPKSSKAALAKVDAADLAAIRGADLKKSLIAHVKSLAHTVDAVRPASPATLASADPSCHPRHSRSHHRPLRSAPARASPPLPGLARLVRGDCGGSLRVVRAPPCPLPPNRGRHIPSSCVPSSCSRFSKCGAAVEACLRVGVGHGVAFDQCHEVLKLISDTWGNINAIPFRCDVGEDVSNVDTAIEVDLGGEEAGSHHLTSPEGLLSLAWPCLLARAAADAAMPDAALLRMIKDAVDHGVDAPHKASEEEEELGEGVVGVRVAAGRPRLSTLFDGRRAEWSGLASTKKKHKMRRAIDRRFDGPKHLRTRDFGSDDEDGYGGYGGFF